jgi:hypothetical protein
MIGRLLTMRFKGTLKSFRIGMSNYKRILHEQLSEEIARAGFLWLNAVLMQIPVWSGASHATFLRLSREVGYQLMVQPRVISRIGYGQRHGDGEVIADPAKGQYSFWYKTTLPHLIYNEFNNANIVPDPTLFDELIIPGPYRFQEAGRKAFEDYARTVRLPNPWVTLKVKAHKVS